MEKRRKYETSGLIEDQYESGSEGRVLRNLLKIKSKREMDRREAQEQLRTFEDVSRLFAENHRFTAEDICQIHKIWLGSIYPWAGKYREVNISKGGFSFTAAQQVPVLIEDFEKNVLQKFTPCRFQSVEEIIAALAIVHTALILIHPFREGNGRLARILSILMCWQAQLPTLDFGGIVGRRKKEYFAAVQAGMAKNYKPMEEIFKAVLRRTLKGATKR